MMLPSVVDDPARSGQRQRTQTILLRLQLVAIVLEHLRVEERAHQRQDDRTESERRNARAAGDVVRMNAHAGDGSRNGRIRSRTMTPAIAVAAAESGDHNTNCCTRSIPERRCSAMK